MFKLVLFTAHCGSSYPSSSSGNRSYVLLYTTLMSCLALGCSRSSLSSHVVPAIVALLILTIRGTPFLPASMLLANDSSPLEIGVYAIIEALVGNAL